MFHFFCGCLPFNVYAKNHCEPPVISSSHKYGLSFPDIYVHAHFRFIIRQGKCQTRKKQPHPVMCCAAEPNGGSGRLWAARRSESWLQSGATDGVCQEDRALPAYFITEISQYENYQHPLFYLADLRNTSHRKKASQNSCWKQTARCSWKSQLKGEGLFVKRHCQPLHVFYFLIKEMHWAYTEITFSTDLSLQNNQKITIQSIHISCSRTDRRNWFKLRIKWKILKPTEVIFTQMRYFSLN